MTNDLKAELIERRITEMRQKHNLGESVEAQRYSVDRMREALAKEERRLEALERGRQHVYESAMHLREGNTDLASISANAAEAWLSKLVPPQT